MSGKGQSALYDTHVKLFRDDVTELQKVAEVRRSKWQVELRQLVHRALKGERRELLLIKDDR